MILSPLCIWQNRGSEKLSFSQAPQLVRKGAKQSSSRTRTTTPPRLQCQIRAQDSNYGEILWWLGIGEFEQQQKIILAPCIFLALYKFSQFLSRACRWSTEHGIKIHIEETDFYPLTSSLLLLVNDKYVPYYKMILKIIEELKLKIVLFSSLLHTIHTGFTGKWTEKIWWPSTWLGRCTSRKGLWNFYRKTSSRPFWGWTYTIMWKSESKFNINFLIFQGKSTAFFTLLSLSILLRPWWFLFQLSFPNHGQS